MNPEEKSYNNTESRVQTAGSKETQTNGWTLSTESFRRKQMFPLNKDKRTATAKFRAAGDCDSRAKRICIHKMHIYIMILKFKIKKPLKTVLSSVHWCLQDRFKVICRLYRGLQQRKGNTDRESACLRGKQRTPMFMLFSFTKCFANKKRCAII